MKLRLILMRHAKSDWSHFGASDHERPLNTRGKKAAAALGNWMRLKAYAPEQVLCSSATRTGETLRRLRLETAPPTIFTRALYLAEAHKMMETLYSASAPCVLMLGHNPGICEMAHRLVDDLPAHVRFSDFPTGATLVCEFDATSWAEVNWREGHVLDFTVPRDLT